MFQRGVSPVRLSKLDVRPAVEAAQMVAAAKANLNSSIGQSVLKFQEKQKEKKQKEMTINALKSFAPGLNEDMYKSAANDSEVKQSLLLYGREKAKADAEIELARIEAESKGESVGYDLESQSQILLPPDEENPFGRIAFGGFPTEGPLAGRMSYAVPGGGFKEAPIGSREFSSNEAQTRQNLLSETRSDIEDGQRDITALKDFYNLRFSGDKENIRSGVNFLKDQISGTFKTFFGKDLNPQELALVEGSAKFQQLLGKIRTEVLGPGVLTEIDAQRLIKALGGFGPTSNPEAVKGILDSIIREKSANLKSKISQYNYTRKLDPITASVFVDEIKDPDLSFLTKSGGKGNDADVDPVGNTEAEDILRGLGL